MQYLLEQQPAMIDFGGLESLAVKAAAKTLPVNVDLFLVVINTRFYLSIRRLKESFWAFVDVTYKRIVYQSYCDTFTVLIERRRWVSFMLETSLLYAIARY